MSKLPLEVFSTVVENTPLVSIDLIVRNSAGQVLLGKRINKPAQNYWFVPGGRIYKNESLEAALQRTIVDELGCGECKLANSAAFKGVYQHFYQDSFVADSISTHYVVLAYELLVDTNNLNLTQQQHNAYIWMNVEELLSDSYVHQYTKGYFK